MHSDDEVMIREHEGTAWTERPMKLNALRSRFTGDTVFDEVVDLKDFKSKNIGTIPAGGIIKLVGLHMVEAGNGPGKLVLGNDLVQLPDLKKNTKKLVKADHAVPKELVVDLVLMNDDLKTPAPLALGGGKVRVVLHYNVPTAFNDVV